MRKIIFAILFFTLLLTPITAANSNGVFNNKEEVELNTCWCNLQCPVCGNYENINHIHMEHGLWAMCRDCGYSGFDFINLDD